MKHFCRGHFTQGCGLACGKDVGQVEQVLIGKGGHRRLDGSKAFDRAPDLGCLALHPYLKHGRLLAGLITIGSVRSHREQADVSCYGYKDSEADIQIAVLVRHKPVLVQIRTLQICIDQRAALHVAFAQSLGDLFNKPMF